MKSSARSTRWAACARANSRTLVVATRGSALALWQTRSVMAQLAGGGIPSTILTVTTKGDDGPRPFAGRDRHRRHLRQRTGTGAARTARRLRGALVQGSAEHAARRHDAGRDRQARRSARCVLQRALRVVRSAARAARASAPRVRAAARCCARCAPDLDLPRHSRQRRHAAAQTARRRVRRDRARRGGPRSASSFRPRYTVPFALDVLVPAVAQGALAIEMRAGDPRTSRACAELLNDPQHRNRGARRARVFAHAARRLSGAGRRARRRSTASFCSIHAAIAAADGSTVIRGDRRATTTSAAEIEAAAWRWPNRCWPKAARRCSAGARRGRPGVLAGALFLLPRTQERPSRIAAALREAGRRGDRGRRRTGGRWPALAGRTPNAILFPSSGSVEAIATYLAEPHGAAADRGGDGAGVGGRRAEAGLAARRRRRGHRHPVVRPHGHAFRPGAHHMNVAERLGSPIRPAPLARRARRCAAWCAKRASTATASCSRLFIVDGQRRRAADRLDAGRRAALGRCGGARMPRARRGRRESRAAVRHPRLQGCRSRPATTIRTASCSAPHARSKTRCRSCW